MKIIKSSVNKVNRDRDVNIHNKQFHTEHLKVGDTVYHKSKSNGSYKTDEESVGTVQDILHSGKCIVLWPWDRIDEPEVCNVEDLITVQKYNDFYEPFDRINSTEAIGIQDFDNNIYADEEIDEFFNDYIYLTLDNVIITVYTDGSWDYEDDTYKFAWNTNVDKDWPVSTYDIADYEFDNVRHNYVNGQILRDYTSVVEDFDQLLESIIPRFTGKYVLNGHAQMVYDVDAYITTSSTKQGYHIEIEDVAFNKQESEHGFKVTITTKD